MRPLNELEPEERGTICEVGGNRTLRKRLLDMGVVPGAEIEVVRIAPLGDPVEYVVKGYRLSLRRSEAAQVLVQDLVCEDCLNLDCPQHRRNRRRRRWRQWHNRWLDRLTVLPGRPGLREQATGEDDSPGVGTSGDDSPS